MKNPGATKPVRGRCSRRPAAWLIVTVALPATAACVIEPGTIQPPQAEQQVTTVPLRMRYSVDCGTRSPAGYGAGFDDPRNGGECWACPNSNPVRTWSAVTASDACATRAVLGIGAQVAADVLHDPRGERIRA